MLTPSDLQPVLSQWPIVLLVEDRLTKFYLKEAWGPEDQLFNILVVGGSSTVRGMVEDQRRHGMIHVFGLVDCDFGETNLARWTGNDVPKVFKPSFHEIENVLLDWPALAGCDLNVNRQRPRSCEEIERTALIEARKQPWWLACRKCLASRQSSVCRGFPKAPTLGDVTDFQPAFDFIANSEWQQSLAERTRQARDSDALESELRAAHRDYDEALANGQWTRRFSGKEIFRVLVSRIRDEPNSVTREPDVDLARSVARWQSENAVVPTDIALLKETLKSRVGLA